MNDALFFLYQEDYGIYSRSLAKYLKSITASVILSELAQRRKYHSDRDEIIFDERYGNGWFYMTHEKMQDRTSLSRKEQDSALKILLAHGLIEQRNLGVPAKRHFRLKDDKILEIYGLSKKHSSLSEKGKLDCPKGTNCNDRKGQTVHIDKEPYKEPKKEEHIEAKPPMCVVSFGSHVKMKQHEHDELVKIHGSDLITEMIETVNDYCAAKGKIYKDYAAAIRNFIKRIEKPDKPKIVVDPNRHRQWTINIMKNCESLHGCLEINATHAIYIPHSGRDPTMIKFSDPDFKGQFEHVLVKNSFKKKENKNAPVQ